MNEMSGPDAITAATVAASGLLGAGIGQRALPRPTTRGERAAYFGGSWACAVLFGPFISRQLGMGGELEAVAAVCGSCAVVGLVVVDSAIRHLRTSGGFVALMRRLFAAFFPGSEK